MKTISKRTNQTLNVWKGVKNITHRQLVAKLEAAFDGSIELDTDNDGQLIWYTGFYENEEGRELSNVPHE